jgi:hypothetical protein
MLHCCVSGLQVTAMHGEVRMKLIADLGAPPRLLLKAHPTHHVATPPKRGVHIPGEADLAAPRRPGRLQLRLVSSSSGLSLLESTLGGAQCRLELCRLLQQLLAP